MDAQDYVGDAVSFAELIFDSDVFGLGVTEDEQRKIVHAAAARLGVVFEEIAPKDRAIKVEIFRSRGVRGFDNASPLSSRNFWGFKLFLWSKSVLADS